MLAAWLPLIGVLAPEALRWLAGDKAGDTAARVVDTVRTITGADTPEAALAAIQDPQVAAQLRIRLAEISADLEKVQRQAERDELLARLADVASARSQTIALAQTGSRIAWGAPVVSVLVAIAFGVVAWSVLTRAVPEGSRDIANIIVGGLIVGFQSVINFWLGSSHGSARKDEALRSLLGGMRR
jgi:hypothetical protein